MAPDGGQQTLLAYLNSYTGSPLSGASSSRSPALPTKPYLLPSLPTSIHPWNITLHLIPCVRLTLNCCSFPVSAHVSVPAASLLLLQLFRTPFLWPFVVVSPFTVFGANSKLSSITLLSGLLNAPPHPASQIRRVSRRHCALYKFTYLLLEICILLANQSKSFRQISIMLMQKRFYGCRPNVVQNNFCCMTTIRDPSLSLTVFRNSLKTHLFVQ